MVHGNDGAAVEQHVSAHPWGLTPLGARAAWPRSLQTTVRIMLDSRYAMWLGWGTELTFLYNDAYASMTLGPKHPGALGRPASQVWAEIWDEIGPRAQSVIETGKATWDEGLLLFLERNGFPEETYHTFSYSPVPDDHGGVGGMLCVVTEDTERTIGERRLQTLRELASRTMDQARTPGRACQIACEILAANPRDVPFALIYLVADDGQMALLTASCGLLAPIPAELQTISVRDGRAPWPFEQVMKTGSPVDIADVAGHNGFTFPGEWPGLANRAVVLPMSRAGEEDVTGFVVAGTSPRRPLDDQYRGFLDLLAKQVSTAVSNAAAFADQRQRAESLAELDRAKTSFFSNVSHEFRTPLTLMLGPLEELMATTPNHLSPDILRQLDVVNRNGMRLMRLVNTLLEFTVIEAGRTRAEFAPTDLAAATVELSSVFRAAVERAGLDFNVECPALPEPVYVDRGMWEKIVLNLLSNALKFTFEGAISLRLEASAGNAELTVSDTGIGIPSDELPQLFQRFHRVRNAFGRTHEGSGIGLALVHELASLHGGTVSVSSVEGSGSSFTVRVPFGTTHFAPEQLVAEHASATGRVVNAFVEEALQWLGKGDVPSTETSPGEPGTLDYDGRAHIVLADDNADMRAYVSRLLAADYRVTVVSNGKEALDAVRRRAPDLIVTDVMMPVMDGFALLEAVRSDPRTADVPVIMLSARAGEDARIEGAESGADDYLVKPFSARELLARVGGHVQLSRMRRTASEAARASEERLQMVLRAARMVAWNYDPGRDVISASDNLAEVYGLRQHDDLMQMNRGLALLPEEDRERHAATVRNAIEERKPYVSQFRVSRPVDGQLAWIEEHGFAFADSDESARMAGVSMDITQRKLAELALREADRKKDEFLATLAHELRNPLAPMRNALELLKLSGDDPQVAGNARSILERQLRQMVRLIDDLLDASRISSGKLELRLERIAIEKVISDALETSRPLIDARGHTLTIQHRAGDVSVMGDAARLAQVFSNLLNNAAKFTRPGGRLVISTEKLDDAVAVSICDSGEGIPAEMIESIFEMFRQVDPRLEKVQGGLGIGLSLVRAIVTLHGGTVQAYSAGEDCGSEFRVVLRATDHVPAPVQDDSRVTSLKPVRTRRVLVVDDNQDAAQSLALMLRVMGYETETANDGQIALESAHVFRPHVVLLDIGMPRLNGYDVCTRLRETTWGARALLVAITGWGQPEAKARSLSAGFDHHLVKPVDPVELAKLLAEAGTSTTK